jgi:hypothetical protein
VRHLGWDGCRLLIRGKMRSSLSHRKVRAVEAESLDSWTTSSSRRIGHARSGVQENSRICPFLLSIFSVSYVY